ncbi:MAG: glycosyltransferase family 2 protein [Candidatus Marinimicrobia bacterium]|nr:glycosyltransferase family 2 protein [Candidatus Neomarinimicrobiota bacterium]
MNATQEPLVSVLICAYRAAPFIAATLKSVCAQTYSRLEILVLDNHSQDDTVAVVGGLAAQDPRIRLFKSTENLGPYGGLNNLLERAQGSFLAIQDHDDLWHPDKLAAQMAFLTRRPDRIGCGAAMLNHYEKYDRFLLRRQAPESTIAWHTSLVFRRGPARYDPHLKVGADFHFMRHALCGGQPRIHNLPAPYVLRRIHADGRNLSSHWIKAGNGRAILTAPIGWLDKLCLLNRLLLSSARMDRLVLGLFPRRRVLTRADLAADPLLKHFVTGLAL